MKIIDIASVVDSDEEQQEEYRGRGGAYEYFVNPDKRTVVCKLYDTEESLLDDIARLGYHPAHQDAYLDGLISQVYIGKAVCCENDTFDEKIGKAIAYKKAIRKLNIAKRKRALQVRNTVDRHRFEMNAIIDQLVRKYDIAIDNCDKKIANIGGTPAPANENNKEG